MFDGYVSGNIRIENLQIIHSAKNSNITQKVDINPFKPCYIIIIHAEIEDLLDMILSTKEFIKTL